MQTPEAMLPPKADPIVVRTREARIASRDYRYAIRAYEAKAADAHAAGLPPPEGKPEKNPQIELGERLDDVSSEHLEKFRQAQKKWVTSGQKEHVALDEAIASLGSIEDSLEQYEAASSAIVQFMDRTDFPLADVTRVAEICPTILHHPNLVGRLINEVIIPRIENRVGEQENYQPQSAFLESVSANSEYLDAETITYLRLYRGRIRGRQIDKLLKSTESRPHGWQLTIQNHELIRNLGLSEKAGLSESQVGNSNPRTLEVPAIVARLSRTTLDPDTREYLQGVVIGLAESMIARRPEHAFSSSEREQWNNLTKAAFEGLANLVDPDEVIYFEWRDKNKNTPLGKMVNKLDETRWHNKWQELASDQGQKIRGRREQAQKVAQEAEAARRKAEAEEKQRAEEKAARLKAETERKARQAVVVEFGNNISLQALFSALKFDSPDVYKVALAAMDKVSPENPRWEDIIGFAKDVLTQHQRLSSPSENLVTRTVGTVIDRPGIAGIGRKTHQETRYGLDDAKYKKELQSARDADKGQYDLSQRAVLEALNLIHQRIYPPST